MKTSFSNSLCSLRLCGCLAVALMFPVMPLLSAQTPGGAALFEKRCFSCHNIGTGDKKGPDLKGATARRSKEWLRGFIESPSAAKQKGDATAAALFQKFAPEVMPDQALAPEQLDAILALIEDLSGKDQSFAPAGATLSRPVTEADIPAGEELFQGRKRLEAGGAACISCHGLEDLGSMGGGTLGPNLTLVNGKYRDPELIAILQNPNFPTMSSVFAAHPLTNEEIVKLFALFQHSKKMHAALAAGAVPADVRFPSIGFGALVLALLGMHWIWRKRLRGVRGPLVRRSRS